MASQQKSVERVFGEALDLPPSQRRAYLDRACGEQGELRRFVDELLLEDERAGSFLGAPLLSYGTSTLLLDASAPGLTRSSEVSTARAPRFGVSEIIDDRFVVIRFIDRGGMGEVYEVEDRFLHGARVALKIIRPEIAAEAGSTHRFEQEVILARKLSHPNLCPIYEIFRCDQPQPPYLFLTMKLLRGQTLGERLKGVGPLPISEAIEISVDLIAAVAAIHAAGVIHRDLKPNNIMLEPGESRVKAMVMDFGIARLHEAEHTLLHSGLIAGTPGYLAPELLRGSPPTQATDLFALGVVLHQVLTGDRPRKTGSAVSLSPDASLKMIPASYSVFELVKGLLSEDPEQRCSVFAKVQSGILQSAVHTPPRLWTRRAFAVSAGSSVCLLAGAAAWQRGNIYDLLHPLPTPRHVAVLNWPSADEAAKAVVFGLIESIESELARAEAYDRDLFVMSHYTPPLRTSAQVSDVLESMGANLSLAVSSTTTPKHRLINLQLLTPTSSQPIRATQIKMPAGEGLTLSSKVVRAAADLLGVAPHSIDGERPDPGTKSPEAYAAFQAAEALMKRENDLGLEAAIEKYKQAIDLDGRYALAVAKLAQAYLRLAEVKHDVGATALARANADAAQVLQPDLATAHLALAGVFDQTGETKSALQELKKALTADPRDYQALVWFAQEQVRLNTWASAEEAFLRAVQLRPNRWLAHNELGVSRYLQGKYLAALSAFRSASLIGPKRIMPLNNTAMIHLYLGRLPEATAELRQSLAAQQSASACCLMSMVLCGRSDPGALTYAKRATELDARRSDAWLELGDCHARLHLHNAQAEQAYAEAARVQRAALETNATDGPGWMLLSLCNAKRQAHEEASANLNKADALPTDDMESQLIKARVLELLGKRQDALVVLEACFRKGATAFQVDLMPDLATLKADTRYKGLLQATRATRST